MEAIAAAKRPVAADFLHARYRISASGLALRLQWRTFLNSESQRMTQTQSKLNQNFINAFRQGQIALAGQALDQGANPAHHAVHALMLNAGPDLTAKNYAEMWKLYFEMRGPLGDAEELEALSGAIGEGPAAIEGRAYIARKAIFANTPKALLQASASRLLPDAAASGDARAIQMALKLAGNGGNRFMLAVRNRLPQVVAQLLQEGVLPPLDQPGIPAALALAASNGGVAASGRLIEALDQRKSGRLGAGWQALIARTMIAASTPRKNSAAGDMKSGQAFWCAVAALRHAHQCEIAGISRYQERKQRAVLLTAVDALTKGLTWDAQWQSLIGLLKAPSIFNAVELSDALKS